MSNRLRPKAISGSNRRCNRNRRRNRRDNTEAADPMQEAAALSDEEDEEALDEAAKLKLELSDAKRTIFKLQSKK